MKNTTKTVLIVLVFLMVIALGIAATAVKPVYNQSLSRLLIRLGAPIRARVPCPAG